MKSRSHGDFVVLKLEDGENFFEALGRACEENGVKSGAILNGIGMLRNFTLGYFPGEGPYDETVFDDPHEMTSMQGNIGMSAGEMVFHVHVNVADRQKNVHGGHLISGDVCVVNEITILKLDGIEIRRQKSPVTGLLEMKI